MSTWSNITEEEEREVEKEFFGGLGLIKQKVVENSKAFGPMSMITKGLYLGSSYNAYEGAHLEKAGIKHIINVCEDELTYEHPGVTKHYYRIRYRSDEQTELFYDLCVLLDKIISGGEGVLVHCVRGRSRSVGVVLCYLIFSKNMCFKRSLDYVRMRRPCIDPVQAIQAQVRLFEEFIDKQRKQEQ